MPATWLPGPMTAHGGRSLHCGSVKNGEISGSTGARLETGATYAGLKAIIGVHLRTTTFWSENADAQSGKLATC